MFKANRPGYLDLAVDKDAIKPAIYEHPEFAAFIGNMNALFADWRAKAAAKLKGLQAGSHPKSVIAGLSEDLLAHYTGKPLIDKYDVYQHLMDYWAETMQDDCYLIAADGWKAETYRIIETDKKGKEKDKGWTCDLVPKALIVARLLCRGAGGHRQARGGVGKHHRPDDRNGGGTRRRRRRLLRTRQGEQGQRHRPAQGDQRRQRGEGRSRRSQ